MYMTESVQCNEHNTRLCKYTSAVNLKVTYLVCAAALELGHAAIHIESRYDTVIAWTEKLH